MHTNETGRKSAAQRKEGTDVESLVAGHCERCGSATQRYGRGTAGDVRIDEECPNCDSVDRGRGLATDGGQYRTAKQEITIVGGVEIDIDLRDTGAGERTVDLVQMDLLERLGRLGAAIEQETPPEELDELDDKYVPMMTPAWDRWFSETDEDGGRDE